MQFYFQIFIFDPKFYIVNFVLEDATIKNIIIYC